MKRLPDPHPDTPTLDQLRVVFESLGADQPRRWGTMTPVEMVRHCRRFVDLYLGEIPVAAPMRLMARMLGPFFLRKMLRGSPRATPRNLRTLPAIRVGSDGGLELDREREELLESFTRIEALAGVVPHPLYGSMHADDVRALVRHHTAHHANQFGLLGEGGDGDG
jgi:hypothetical protein